MGIFLRFTFVFLCFFSFSAVHAAERSGVRTDFESAGVRLIAGETLEILRGDMTVRPFSSLSGSAVISPLSRSLSPSPFWVAVTLVNDGDEARNFVIDSDFRDFIFGSAAWPLSYPSPGILQGFSVSFSASSSDSDARSLNGVILGSSGSEFGSFFRPLEVYDSGIFSFDLAGGEVKDIVLELRDGSVSGGITVWHGASYFLLSDRFFAFEFFLLGSMAVLFLTILFFSFSFFSVIYVGIVLFFFGSLCFMLGEFGTVRRFFSWFFLGSDYVFSVSFFVSQFRLLGDIFLLTGISGIFYACLGGSGLGVLYRRLFLLYIFSVLLLFPLGWFFHDWVGLSVRILLGFVGIVGLCLCLFMYFRSVLLWRHFLVFWCLFSFWYVLSFAGSFLGYPHMLSSFIPSVGLVIVTGIGIWSVVLSGFDYAPVLGGRGRSSLALSGSGHHMWDWHIDDDSIYVDSGLEHALGLPSGHLSSLGWQGWLSLIHTGDRSDFILSLEDSHHDGRIFECRLRLHHCDGRWIWHLLRGRVMRDDSGHCVRVIGLVRDYSAQVSDEDRLLRCLVLDGVTGLPGRILFEHLLRHRLSLDFGLSGDRLYVLSMMVCLDRCASGFIDLDDLREDIFVSLCSDLRDDFGDLGILSRFSRRCFVGSLFFASDSDAESFGSAVCSRADDLFTEMALPLRLHMGISVLPTGSVCGDVSDLIDVSFSALHVAQSEDCSVILRVFDGTLSLTGDSSQAGDSSRVLSLRSSMDSGLFDLGWLPLVSPSDFSFLGCVGSLSWDEGGDGDHIISHGSLFEIADSYGLSDELGGYFLDVSVRHLGSWQRSFDPSRVPFMILPLPSVGLLTHDLVLKIERLLPREEVLSGSLYIEVSESVIAINPDYASRIFSGLRALGVGIVCGDYRGFILEYLPSLPIDILRLSPCLVRGLKRSEMVLGSTISLAHSLSLRVLYGSVSGVSENTLLSDFGCDYVGGHYFGGVHSSASLLSLMGSDSDGFVLSSASDADGSVSLHRGNGSSGGVGFFNRSR